MEYDIDLIRRQTQAVMDKCKASNKPPQKTLYQSSLDGERNLHYLRGIGVLRKMAEDGDKRAALALKIVWEAGR